MRKLLLAINLFLPSTLGIYSWKCSTSENSPSKPTIFGTFNDGYGNSDILQILKTAKYYDIETTKFEPIEFNPDKTLLNEVPSYSDFTDWDGKNINFYKGAPLDQASSNQLFDVFVESKNQQSSENVEYEFSFTGNSDSEKVYLFFLKKESGFYNLGIPYTKTEEVFAYYIDLEKITYTDLTLIPDYDDKDILRFLKDEAAVYNFESSAYENIPFVGDYKIAKDFFDTKEFDENGEVLNFYEGTLFDNKSSNLLFNFFEETIDLEENENYTYKFSLESNSRFNVCWIYLLQVNQNIATKNSIITKSIYEVPLYNFEYM
ncbi:hypothetical protein [Spiroplasma clarkii]|uniref:Uncharacterized protein n=1 Tax=Spiroplasma clarkii TaxID=2139 RepID=A0A2K8KKV0_9MOLU|nr:hypothetical protein [Spiroplasma clarkii]ATX71119.1 hypothetical protein SCLAR_v1c08060 [Spiroplasma clarkii]